MKGCNVSQCTNDSDISMEEREVFARIQADLGDDPTLEKCAEQFFLVKTCWNQYELSLMHNMTFERACHTLREVRDATYGKKGGNLLSAQAHKLLWEIVDRSAPIPEVELAEVVHGN